MLEVEKTYKLSRRIRFPMSTAWSDKFSLAAEWHSCSKNFQKNK